MTLKCPLTPRQLQCIELSSDGYSAKRIAHALGISYNTTNDHLRKARIASGAKTEPSLVALAIRRGWIA